MMVIKFVLLAHAYGFAILKVATPSLKLSMTHFLETDQQRVMNLLMRQTNLVLSMLLLSISTPAFSENIEPKRTVGFKAPESPFSPSKTLYVPPVLPQSALINSLITNPQVELLGQLQAYLESFCQLSNPSQNQMHQIQRNSSVLWKNLRTNAQRAAGMFVYNQRALSEIGEGNQSGSELSSEENVKSLKENLLLLVNVTKSANSNVSLQVMQAAMNNLLDIANVLSWDRGPSSARSVPVPHVHTKSPTLRGRAKVKITFQLLHDNSDENEGPLLYGPTLPALASANTYVKGSLHEVIVMVDGINYPITAGNFVDLCNKHFYDNLFVTSRPFAMGNVVAPLTVLGEYEAGYVDPITQRPRRLPLEVLREGTTRPSEVYADAPPNGGNSNPLRYTATGGAHNSALFTRARPVQSFSTYGALGMYHAPGDLNGASSSIFWHPLGGAAGGATEAKRQLLQRNVQDASREGLRRVLSELDEHYSLFAYVLQGAQVLPRLRPGDLVKSARVLPQGLCDAYRHGDTDEAATCAWELHTTDT